MEWNASDIALPTALWTKGQSAGQIADRLTVVTPITPTNKIHQRVSGHTGNGVTAVTGVTGVVRREHRPRPPLELGRQYAKLRYGSVANLCRTGGANPLGLDRQAVP
jgi:hypothetical protein